MKTKIYSLFRELRDLYSYHLKSTIHFAEHDVHNVFEKTIHGLSRFGFNDIIGKRILDLGCGQRFPFALQCAANGAKVTALDIDYTKPDFLPLSFFRTIKHNGIKRAIKSAFRRLLFDNNYYHAMEISSAKPLRLHQSEIHFIVYNHTSASYPLPSSSFDLIASNAVLEHVKDVPKFAEEVARLLDSGGYFYAIIHNFYSLSGGHNLEWAYPDESPPKNVPAWDHLRENRFPVWVYLNHFKAEQFIGIFSKHFQILNFEGVGINYDPGKTEGERFLTSEIASELSSYPKDLLLTRSWCMICKKV